MEPSVDTTSEQKLVQRLGLLDSTMIVAGSMIGSGIFIVSLADISKKVGSPGWLLVVWLVTGALTLIGALSYGELAAMMPRAGGMYVYLREAYSPLWGFLYGWTYFTVIQTGIAAAVAIAFARFMGLISHRVAAQNWIVAPLHLSQDYAISLSTQQLAAIVVLIVLTILNTRGLKLGAAIQTTFTLTKLCTLAALILIGVVFVHNAPAIKVNFGDFWTPAQFHNDQLRPSDPCRQFRRRLALDC